MKKILATELGKAPGLPQFFCVDACAAHCVAEHCWVLQRQCMQYCHTSFAVSHKLVQTAFCAPSIRLIAVAGLLQYALLFCCHDIAHVVVALFFLCRCPGLQFRNSTILKLAVSSFKRVVGLEAEMLQKQKSPQGTHIGSPFFKNVYD